MRVQIDSVGLRTTKRLSKVYLTWLVFCLIRAESMKKIINALEFIHKHGMLGFAKECYYRLFNILNCYYENHFDVNTKGWVSTAELGIHNDESVHYESVHYRRTINILNKVPVNKNESTLLDYGCGKGRVIIAAASYQYKKIIGVELSSLIKIAENNIDKMKHRKTKNIVLKKCDAQDYKVPSDVNIIYFYNPFIGSVLENVIRNIYSSYKETPRKIYIVYFNNVHFDKIISHQDWLTKIYQVEPHPVCPPYGLYETTSLQQ
jgi:SAM-dependent methyltransferase